MYIYIYLMAKVYPCQPPCGGSEWLVSSVRSQSKNIEKQYVFKDFKDPEPPS